MDRVKHNILSLLFTPLNLIVTNGKAVDFINLIITSLTAYHTNEEKINLSSTSEGRTELREGCDAIGESPNKSISVSSSAVFVGGE